ncbi:MAG TPA: Crp/Fnr family transcriptional regulator [Burkholderiales bacterium]|jgi:CRP-like cAMP-binding protein|nr:Crp/Fnr family transcriptional regulator [Burkholderiales bacterium]
MTINSLLSRLPRKAGESHFPGLKRIDLRLGQVLHDSGKRMTQVYFPTTSLVSIVSHEQDEIAVELGVIGRDGMVGVAVALGEQVSAARAVVQAEGSAMRSSSADFRREFKRRTGMQRDIFRYSNELATQVMRTASCNRNHTSEQRLARWLLMMRDRLSTDRYRMTQEYLGYMLGVPRAAINEAAGRLQRRQLIRYVRGNIEILDGKGLKAASCACYREWKD